MSKVALRFSMITNIDETNPPQAAREGWPKDDDSQGQQEEKEETEEKKKRESAPKSTNVLVVTKTEKSKMPLLVFLDFFEDKVSEEIIVQIENQYFSQKKKGADLVSTFNCPPM